MVEAEAVEHVVELVVDGDLLWLLDHVGAQVEPLLETLFDHVF